jgi:hypothetical protein
LGVDLLYEAEARLARLTRAGQGPNVGIIRNGLAVSTTKEPELGPFRFGDIETFGTERPLEDSSNGRGGRELSVSILIDMADNHVHTSAPMTMQVAMTVNASLPQGDLLIELNIRLLDPKALPILAKAGQDDRDSAEFVNFDHARLVVAGDVPKNLH